MPAWMIGAITLLGLIATREGGVPGLPAAIDPFERGGLALPFGIAGIGEGRQVDAQGRIIRRRRRRRALTNSDRNDIAFIAATIGKSAAGSFAVQLATRSR